VPFHAPLIYRQIADDLLEASGIVAYERRFRMRHPIVIGKSGNESVATMATTTWRPAEDTTDPCDERLGRRRIMDFRAGRALNADFMPLWPLEDSRRIHRRRCDAWNGRHDLSLCRHRPWIVAGAWDANRVLLWWQTAT
jgi:hypothetical protein